jgi:hypothetical protein
LKPSGRSLKRSGGLLMRSDWSLKRSGGSFMTSDWSLKQSGGSLMRSDWSLKTSYESLKRYDGLINHPGRKQTLHCIDYIYIAATPPLKGGETYTIPTCLKTTLRLTALPHSPSLALSKSRILGIKARKL